MRPSANTKSKQANRNEKGKGDPEGERQGGGGERRKRRESGKEGKKSPCFVLLLDINSVFQRAFLDRVIVQALCAILGKDEVSDPCTRTLQLMCA